jgi:hypothetical protein
MKQTRMSRHLVALKKRNGPPNTVQEAETLGRMNLARIASDSTGEP